jgi:archaetidylserine synthase
VWPIGGLYLACGILRLARFNVSPKNSQFFEGLPIPPCGVAVSASVLLGWPEFTLMLILILSLLMVSSINYPKVRDLRAAMPLVLVLVIAAALFSTRGKLGYLSISSFSIITAMIAYALSPVVMPFLQKER